MNVKGQNLRIFLDGQAIAAALSATVQATATIAESTTKDSEGDWDEYEVVSKKLTVSAEALFGLYDGESGYFEPTGQRTIQGSTWYVGGPFRVKKGDLVSISCADEIGLAIFHHGEAYILKQTTQGQHSLEWTSDRDGDIDFGTINMHVKPCAWHIENPAACHTPDEFMQMLSEGNAFTLNLALATGEMNREMDQVFLQCDVFVTDINISAQNRQRTTYNVTFTPNGPVQLLSADGQMLATLSYDGEEDGVVKSMAESGTQPKNKPDESAKA